MKWRTLRVWLGSAVLLGVWGGASAARSPQMADSPRSPVTLLTRQVAQWGASATTTIAPITAKSRSPQLAQAPAASSPQIQVLSQGVNPRQVLQFRPQVNTRRTLTVTLNQDVALQMMGRSLPKMAVPPIVMTMDTEITKVEADGTTHYRFEYTEIDVQASDQANPTLVSVLKSRLAELEGLNGTIVMDAQGHTRSSQLDLPDDLDANTRQILTQLGQAMQEMSAPLPTVAIGPGAQWRVRQTPTLNGIAITQVSTFELVRLENGQAVLDVALTQTAANQTINVGALGNRQATLKRLQAEGQGQTVLNLTDPLGARSQLTLQSTSEMEVAVPGLSNAMPLTMQSDIRMLVQPL